MLDRHIARAHNKTALSSEDIRRQRDGSVLGGSSSVANAYSPSSNTNFVAPKMRRP
jgi:hypothetical protein